MNNDLVFLPVLAHVLLVFMLYIYLGIAKSRVVKAGGFDRKAASLNPKAWPESVVKVSNNIANQFESPILFYVLSIIYYLTNNADGILLAVMSIYVVSRYLHAYIHVTSNYVPYRLKLFLVGVLMLLGLTLWLVYRLVG